MVKETLESPPPPTAETPKVDLGRAILPQVAALGADYEAWVHDAVSPKAAVLANDREDSIQPERWKTSLRIFESPFWESMSHIPWWLVLVIWVPIVIALFVVSTAVLGAGIGQAFLFAFFGAFTWTFVEYVLHRFVFHYIPSSPLGIKIHFLAHGIHHLDPWDGTRLVFPPLAGLGIATLLFGLFNLMMPLPLTCAFMSGLLTGYLAYDMTHYYTHHAKPKSRWGRFVKQYHLAHHHKHWNHMFGVSQPLWDIVFRSGRPKDGRP